eukprot:CAMPEP_0117667480 /NCGR_PEP_ID=MMETSP0804-20121206/10995_1 /TAXON_ID=1074897 /ORGANISM="Tetraselmis astigmatica, Strain CCMP880" /LENGTH=90 /DNA_ID=CAMNT_0005475221 /DNA_START=1207 /DNA_END=1479 /DNA_ORIENTATION=+
MVRKATRVESIPRVGSAAVSTVTLFFSQQVSESSSGVISRAVNAGWDSSALASSTAGANRRAGTSTNSLDSAAAGAAGISVRSSDWTPAS